MRGLNVFPELVRRRDFGHVNRVSEREFPIRAPLIRNLGDNLDPHNDARMFLQQTEDAAQLFGVVGVTRTGASLPATS